jgi:gas vesicle protein
MHIEDLEQRASWRSSVGLFVMGTAVGAVAALMMAPSSGRDARAYLRKQSRKVAHDVSEQSNRIASAVKAGREQLMSGLKERVDTAVGQGKAAYEAAKSHRTSPSAFPDRGTGPTSPV